MTVEKKIHKIIMVPVSELHIDYEFNYRKDYDFPSMMDDILMVGRVIEPLLVCKRPGTPMDGMLIRGNRRFGATEQLLADANLNINIRKNLEKLAVIYYEGFNDDEIRDLMLDHGSQKSLNREETVLAVWRMQQQMHSFISIATKMFQLLARYTNSPAIAYEVQAMPVGAGRTERIRKWLKGTLDDNLLKAGKMGDMIKEQVLLADRKIDHGKLSDGDAAKVRFNPKRERIGKLWTAKGEDEKNNVWDHKTMSGPTFNALVEKFALEDSGQAPSDGKKPAPNKKDMKSTGDSMKSMALKTAFRKCAGDLSEGELDTDHFDTEIFRQEQLVDSVKKNLNLLDLSMQLTGAELQVVLQIFINGTPAQLELELKKFHAKLS